MKTMKPVVLGNRSLNTEKKIERFPSEIWDSQDSDAGDKSKKFPSQYSCSVVISLIEILMEEIELVVDEK